MNSARIKDEFGRTEGHVLFDANWWKIGIAQVDDQGGRRLWRLYDNAGAAITDEQGKPLALWTLADARHAMARHHEAQGEPWPAP